MLALLTFGFKVLYLAEVLGCKGIRSSPSGLILVISFESLHTDTFIFVHGEGHLPVTHFTTLAAYTVILSASAKIIVVIIAIIALWSLDEILSITKMQIWYSQAIQTLCSDVRTQFGLPYRNTIFKIIGEQEVLALWFNLLL